MSETREPQRMRRDLRDSYTFWLSVALAFLALGGTLMGVTATVTIPKQHGVWSSDGFIAGTVVVGVGAALMLWAIIIYARSRFRTSSDLTDGPPTTIDRASMRSILREIRPDLQESLARLTIAQSTGRFWKSTAGLLPDYGWNRYRQMMSAAPNIGIMFDNLDLAFGHIRQINSIYTARTRDRSALPLRFLDRNPIRPEDDLPTAITAISGAIRAVERQLYELG